jgi:hypothetical protein
MAFPMFQVAGNLLIRSPREGHLPLHLAASIYLATLSAPGPVNSSDGWAYAYPADKYVIDLVRACLGGNFVFGSGGKRSLDNVRSTNASFFGMARHRTASVNIAKLST